MKKERYPMCESQPAQIDCRKSDCIWHKEASCTNVSPAITLNPNKEFVCWSEEEKKPIFKLNNKFMYEGDEYWVVRLAENWRLSKRLVKNRKPITSKLKYIFQTKQEALEFVLEEAKERFKNASQAACQKSEPFNINSDKFFIEHVGCHETIGNEKNYVWTENKGFVAEPIKEPSLMLGNEVVEIEKEWIEETCATEGYRETIIKCKGESVTKEEWIKFYHSLKESWEWVKEATLQLGNYEVFFSRSDDSLHFGCVDGIENVTIEQIESITKALNEL